MKRILYLLSLFLIVLIFCEKNRDHCDGIYAPHLSLASGSKPFFWPKNRLPLKVDIDYKNLQDIVVDGNINEKLFRQSLSQWDAVVSHETFFHQRLGKTDIVVSKGPIDDPDILAETRIGYIDYGDFFEIFHAEIIFNEDYPFSIHSQTKATYDLQSVFTHEIGHLLGLDHPKDKKPFCRECQQKSAMKASINAGQIERTPSFQDKNEIRRIYAYRNLLSKKSCVKKHTAIVKETLTLFKK